MRTKSACKEFKPGMKLKILIQTSGFSRKRINPMNDTCKLTNPINPFADQLRIEDSMTLKIKICFFYLTSLQLT